MKPPLPVTHSGSRGKAPARRDAACEATADRRAVVLLGNVSTEIELPDKNNPGKKKIDRSDFFGSVSDHPFTPRCLCIPEVLDYCQRTGRCSNCFVQLCLSPTSEFTSGILLPVLCRVEISPRRSGITKGKVNALRAARWQVTRGSRRFKVFIGNLGPPGSEIFEVQHLEHV